MSFGEDDEILQDFLVEAGEILDQLSEQLVELEQRPDDRNLLNAIFRGFHTVKGGAGFLQLDAMVECCHATENLFDILRNGKRDVTPALMDVVLQALDTVNAQFQQISQRKEPTRASAELMANLAALVNGGDTPAASSAADPVKSAPQSPAQPPANEPAAEFLRDVEKPGALDLTDDEFEGFLEAISDKKSADQKPAAASSSTAGAAGSDEISEDEFEALLDQLNGVGQAPGKKAAPAAPTTPPSAPGDEISEDEFEALLDEIHGAGKGPGVASTQGASAPGTFPTQGASTQETSTTGEPASPAAPASDLISDSEFEDLLDQLQGRGKGPTASGSTQPAQPPAAEAASADDAVVQKTVVQKTAGQKTAGQKTAAHETAAHDNDRQAAAPNSAPSNRDGGQAAASNAANQAEATVRVDTQRLDDIMNMVGELVLVRNRLVRLGLDSSDESLSKAVANLDVVTADLQTAVMKTRMQPIKKVFGRFPRVVRDLARNLKKEIHLELVGEETDLDKNLVEALADPLVHLVRNSVDHGIELPSVRESVGKSRVGKVVLSAEQEGDHILLSITDDGAGMDPVKLREKAVEKGLMEADAAARLSDVEAFNLIFAPGFSTKTEISDVSGRGVGMDVVKTKIAQLNGSVEIHSKKGEGTRLSIKVPLTLAIMPTLMIMLERQAFALPLVNVNEIFQMDLTKSHVVDGQECVTIRDKAIPIFHLKRWLVRGHYDGRKIQGAHVVIVTVGTRRVGFVVDQLIGQEEVVIKPLGKMLQGTPGMAGATITGDGTIALILDVPSLLKRYAGGI
jgi:two-component system chemotaxis sensor kinase CheA